MNPYYTVFFAPAIEGPLKLVARRLARKRAMRTPAIDRLRGRALGRRRWREALIAF